MADKIRKAREEAKKMKQAAMMKARGNTATKTKTGTGTGNAADVAGAEGIATKGAAVWRRSVKRKDKLDLAKQIAVANADMLEILKPSESKALVVKMSPIAEEKKNVSQAKTSGRRLSSGRKRSVLSMRRESQTLANSPVMSPIKVRIL